MENDYQLIFDNISPRNVERNCDPNDGCGQCCTEVLLSTTDLKLPSEKQNDFHLSDLEHQVENAEVRCGTLQQQLDYMKMLYQNKFDYKNETEQGSDSENMLCTSELEFLFPKHTSTNNNVDSHDDSHNYKDATIEIEGNDIHLPNSLKDEKENERSNEELEINIDSLPDERENNKNELDHCCTFGNITAQSIPIESEINSFFMSQECCDNEYPIHTEHDVQSEKCNEIGDTKEVNKHETNHEMLLKGITEAGEMEIPKAELSLNTCVENPMKTIQGILNGIAGSVSVISQLSVKASSSTRRESVKKYFCHRQKSPLNRSRTPGRAFFENTNNLSDQQILNNSNVSCSKNILYQDENNSPSRSYKSAHCHRHHHHHHHRHTHKRNGQHHHHFSHQYTHNADADISCMTPCVSEYIYPEMAKGNFYPTYYLKYDKRRCHRLRERNSIRKFSEIKDQKSFSDLRSFSKNIKSSRIKLAEARTEKCSVLDNATKPQKDCDDVKRLKNNVENHLVNKSERRLKQRKNHHVPQSHENGLVEITETNSHNNNNNNDIVNNHKQKKGKRVTKSQTCCDIQRKNDTYSLKVISKNSEMVNTSMIKETKERNSDIMTSRQTNQRKLPQETTKLESEHFPGSLAGVVGCSPNFSCQTYSSKLKQSDKPLTNLFNFRNIPFVVGTSTARSHNLALNLQQALSILKMRSPSIGGDLATEVASSFLGPQSRPSSAESTKAHKICCPLAVAQMKSSCSHLPADSIASEFSVCLTRSAKVSSERDSFSGTSESLLKSQTEGDNSQKTHVSRKQNVWELDEPIYTKSIRCTCFPTKPCTNYQKLLSEYVSNAEYEKCLSTSIQPKIKKENNCLQSPTISTSKISQNRLIALKDVNVTHNNEENKYEKSQTDSKEIKEILTKLQKDFIKLNEKCDYLKHELEYPQVNARRACKELDFLESELNKKEGDIEIILGLHRELQSLKEEVQLLRIKGNSLISTAKPAIPNVLPRDPPISVRLTRLLRTIQKFQDKFLNE